MLRRKPTAITITPEDLVAFEEERQRQASMENNDDDNNNNNNNNTKGDGYPADSEITNKKYDPNDELKPLPGDKARIVRSRDERIGISRRT
jgi:hypothetical protein